MASLQQPMYGRRSNYGYEPNNSIYGGNHNNNYDPYYSNKNHQDHIPIHSEIPPYSVSPPSHHRTTNNIISSSPIKIDDAAAGIEWKETPEAHIFKTALPVGVRREDVKVQLEDDRILRISAERVTETGDRRKNWRHVEVSGARFMTAITLPDDARADLVKSYWENGVLTVKIPRMDMAHNFRHHVRNVEINDY